MYISMIYTFWISIIRSFRREDIVWVASSMDTTFILQHSIASVNGVPSMSTTGKQLPVSLENSQTMMPQNTNTVPPWKNCLIERRVFWVSRSNSLRARWLSCQKPISHNTFTISQQLLKRGSIHVHTWWRTGVPYAYSSLCLKSSLSDISESSCDVSSFKVVIKLSGLSSCMMVPSVISERRPFSSDCSGSIRTINHKIKTLTCKDGSSRATDRRKSRYNFVFNALRSLSWVDMANFASGLSWSSKANAGDSSSRRSGLIKEILQKDDVREKMQLEAILHMCKESTSQRQRSTSWGDIDALRQVTW